MNNLITKQVNFHGDNLMAAKDKNTGKIYTGVSYICRGIGLTKSQKDTQVQNVQGDLVLQKGCLKFQAGVLESNNSTVAIDIDFLPLWLAKISITPKMQEEQPEVVEKLIQYQLNAKDVLADAFIKPKSENSMKIVSMLHEEIGQLISVTTDVQNRVSKLEKEDYIKPFQKKALINARTSKVFEITGGKQSCAYKDKSFRSKVYQDIFRNIKNIYNVNEYDAIPKQKFSEALKLINEYQLPLQLKYELERINEQVKFSEEAI